MQRAGRGHPAPRRGAASTCVRNPAATPQQPRTTLVSAPLNQEMWMGPLLRSKFHLHTQHNGPDQTRKNRSTACVRVPRRRCLHQGLLPFHRQAGQGSGWVPSDPPEAHSLVEVCILLLPLLGPVKLLHQRAPEALRVGGNTGVSAHTCADGLRSPPCRRRQRRCRRATTPTRLPWGSL